MADNEPREGAAEIRAVLAKATEPLNVAEIFERCGSIENTTQIASMLCEEVRTGRAVRTGTRGSYRYALTPSGRHVVDNPRFLRGRGNRRTRGRGLPPPPVLPARTAKPDDGPLPPLPESAYAPDAKPLPVRRSAEASARLRTTPAAANVAAPAGAKPSPKAAPAAAPAPPPPPTETSVVAQALAPMLIEDLRNSEDPWRHACAVSLCWPGGLAAMPADLQAAVLQALDHRRLRAA